MHILKYEEVRINRTKRNYVDKISKYFKYPSQLPTLRIKRYHMRKSSELNFRNMRAPRQCLIYRKFMPQGT